MDVCNEIRYAMAYQVQAYCCYVRACSYCGSRVLTPCVPLGQTGSGKTHTMSSLMEGLAQELFALADIENNKVVKSYSSYF
jgi:DNA replication protein DnaC